MSKPKAVLEALVLGMSGKVVDLTDQFVDFLYEGEPCLYRLAVKGDSILLEAITGPEKGMSGEIASLSTLSNAL
jgi:hypothetical protein